MAARARAPEEPYRPLGPSDAAALVGGSHADPFGVLGMHRAGGALAVRAFRPDAARVQVLDRSGRAVAELARVHPGGLFEGPIPRRKRPFAYRLRLHREDGTALDVDDAYRFGPLLGEIDTYLIAEGTHLRLDEKLGAHAATIDGCAGTTFAVWAPNAARVSVVGDFNDWDGRRHPMRLRVESGVWEIFVPAVGSGALYKYEILARDGTLLPLKSDPLAFAMQRAPQTASIVAPPGFDGWTDDAWLARRAAVSRRDAPISIYEVHLGSWRRGPDNRYLTYGELGDELIPYATSMGFTHLELLPISEYPFDGSWGYQTIGLYAPTSRFGPPAEFARFVDRAHAAGLGIILDWVPGHFPKDEYGLAKFDGTHLYEHADPRLGVQPDWDTLVYNFGRREVRDFLINNALFWLRHYHVDGLRVDAVASMLYLDFSRKPGEWVPNEFGGNENLAAVEFLKRTNELAYGEHPGIATYAEESSAWPNVSAPTSEGGLGFGYKWNMGWMHDTLDYMAEDPVYRKAVHRKITFGLWYAWDENFVLPLSHDEVVHLKRSLLGKMPGDAWQRFANLRAYYGFMWTHPGKKLLFMGGEFAQEREWSHDRGLDWDILAQPRHLGVQSLVRDLNALYRAQPALHEMDCEHAGFEWIDADDEAHSVFSYIRRARDPGDHVVVVANFTPVVREGFRLGVPGEGGYVELLNTDAAEYGGSGVRNDGVLPNQAVAATGHARSVQLTLPPLGTVVLRPA
jgi:1,4-alpha-glucan branching enzyme